MSKCLYSGYEHTPEPNKEGGFVYCAECGEIIKITDQEKADIWFNNSKWDKLKQLS